MTVLIAVLFVGTPPTTQDQRWTLGRAPGRELRRPCPEHPSILALFPKTPPLPPYSRHLCIPSIRFRIFTPRQSLPGPPRSPFVSRRPAFVSGVPARISSAVLAGM